MKTAVLFQFALKSTSAARSRFSARMNSAVRRPEDPETIHDIRVSIRRYTQCLRVFQDLFDPAGVKRTRKRLKKLMDLCGETRNYDIAQDVLREAGIPEDHPAYVRLRSARTKAAEELTGYLAKKRWKSFVAKNPVRPGSSVSDSSRWQLDGSVPANAARVLPLLCSEFFQAGAAAAAAQSDYETLHAFRLRAKRFRYTLEIFQAVYGASMNKKLKDLRVMQDRLGEINDCLTTLELVRRRRDLRRPIAELLARREEAFRICWIRRFEGRKSHSWIRWLAKPSAEGSVA
jgi:CHAD domain-containing protein